MSLPDNVRVWFFNLLTNSVIQQLAPLLVILLIPLLVLTFATRSRRNSLVYSGAMVLESLGLGLSWNWSNGHPSVSTHERKKSKKKHVRTRAEQIGHNGNARHDSVEEDKEPDEGYYPGLVNISGTYCFMNSTLQAMASLCYLQPHIDTIHAKAEALDVPSPVIDALQELQHALNTPHSSPASIRPFGIISALSDHSPGKNNTLFNSHEHQDAQELFQLLSECIKKETAAVDKEGYRDRGLGGLAQLGETNREIGKGVFDGLTANRRSCVECGYTEAVMHFAFDNWQLAVPRLVASCQLEDCLAEYTKLEVLTDCICRKCSMLATRKRLVQDAERLSESTKGESPPSASRKKRAREARKLAALVKTAIDEGRIEDDIAGVKMEKVFSKASTKQAMVARPPPILALHINRSVHYGQYASKNTVRVIFPEILDLTPFTTSGKLSTLPSVPISSPPSSVLRSTTPTTATYGTPRVIYRLSAIVCHYGQHSFGHYIAYRRKPRPVSSGPKRYAPPKLVDPLPYDGAGEQARLTWEDEHDKPTRPECGWLRISDESVRECGIETVLHENSGVFMLYYERVLHTGLDVYPRSSSSPRSSEETLKPETINVHHLNGSASSLVSVGEGVALRRGREDNDREMEKSMVGVGKALGPRIVRSVAAGRGKRSVSAAPSERERSTTLSTSSEAELTPKRGDSPLPPPNGVVADGSAAVDEPKMPQLSWEFQPPLPQPIRRQVSPPSGLSTSVSQLHSVSASTSSASSTLSSVVSHPPPPRIHSPQPMHAPVGPSMVGLRA